MKLQPITLRNNIKAFRTEKNITQQELAEIVGVSSRTIISLEKEQYNPSVLLAHRLARFFDKYIEELFLFKEYEENG